MDVFGVSQMIQDRTLSAENATSLFKDVSAVLVYQASSPRASRKALVQRCRLRAASLGTPPGKDVPFPARLALRPTTFRLAEPVHITLKEYW